MFTCVQKKLFLKFDDVGPHQTLVLSVLTKCAKRKAKQTLP